MIVTEEHMKKMKTAMEDCVWLRSDVIVAAMPEMSRVIVDPQTVFAVVGWVMNGPVAKEKHRKKSGEEQVLVPPKNVTSHFQEQKGFVRKEEAMNESLAKVIGGKSPKQEQVFKPIRHVASLLQKHKVDVKKEEAMNDSHMKISRVLKKKRVLKPSRHATSRLRQQKEVGKEDEAMNDLQGKLRRGSEKETPL